MIRLATENDLKRILSIYEYAREFMRNNGNESQWKNNFPPKELIVQDIEKRQLYVYVEDNNIHGVFASFNKKIVN